MSKIIEKLIISLLIVLLCANFVFPNLVCAQTEGIKDPLGEFAGGVLDGVFGMLLYPWKLLLIVPVAIIRIATNSIANGYATLQTIFFNKIDLLNINIFEEASDASMQSIRHSVATFYVAFRNLAIVLSFAVLIYIGIRMAIDSTGENRAKYKAMLVNWVVGFGLIFVLHYIIVFVIYANEFLVNSLATEEVTNTDYMQTLLKQAWYIPFTTSFASIAMYCALMLMTFIFLITYIKRMITVCFLIVIAPLISVTYSIDKIGNNKSEILDTWLKEFLYNVLIQPFHCVIYSVFIGTAMNLISANHIADGSSFGAMVFAIILTFCIFLGQKIIREIFGFEQSKSFYEKAVDFALITATYNNVKNTVKNVAALKGSKNDKAAKAQEKMFSNLDATQPITADDMVQARMSAEAHRQEENAPSNGGGGAQNPQPQPNSTGNSSKPYVKLRRRLKNKPRFVKRAARFYTRNLRKYTGYNTVNNIIKNRQRSRVSPTKLNNRDYAIAISQMYREAQNANPNMSNRELAMAYERIMNENIVNLNSEELTYRMRMEALKNEVGITDDEVKDAIVFGSSQNRRWKV